MKAMKKQQTTITDTLHHAAETKTPAPTLKKVSLAEFTMQTPGSKSAKAYPLLPDPDGQATELVTSILEKSAQLEALKGALEVEKAELIAIAKPFYLTHHHGQHAVTSSVEAHSADGKVVRVGFNNSYRGTSDETSITRIAGEHAARFFKQTFELKIKGDAIPENAVEPLLAELQGLFARHGASAALSAKAIIKPTKEFHTARHTLFSVEENFELDKIVLIIASVKAKLGKGGNAEE